MSRAALLERGQERVGDHSPAGPFEFWEADATVTEITERQVATVGFTTLKCAELGEMPAAHESRKSFDVLASVNMFRADLARYGRVLPETRQRVYDEELSLMAEGMDRAANTRFSLRRQDGDLMYNKNGAWESYTGMLLTGREVAVEEAVTDPRKQFLAEDAVNDYAHGLEMRALMPGERKVWTSTYRFDVADQYGPDFMKDCGRFPDRQMGFIYLATADAQGVEIESQTVDLSDPEAFAAVTSLASFNPDVTMLELRRAYDNVLEVRNGGRYSAGRKNAKETENAWKEITDQVDLVAYFMDELEAIAGRPLYGDLLERTVKEHMYGSWAAFRTRLDNPEAYYYVPEKPLDVYAAMAQAAMLRAEIDDAFNNFVRNGKTMVGCGGSIHMLGMDQIMQDLEQLLRMPPQEVFDAITAPRLEDGNGALTFDCPKCKYENQRSFNGWVYNCRNCHADVSCGRKR